eukprot:6715693-Heterocapsa_arctica.AAC.1
MEEKNKTWERQIGVPAIFIEQLACYAKARAKTYTFIMDCNSGVGMWRICRNPKCYRCSIIDKAEMKTDIPLQKGETINFLGRIKTEDVSWKDTSVKQNIRIIVIS